MTETIISLRGIAVAGGSKILPNNASEFYVFYFNRVTSLPSNHGGIVSKILDESCMNRAKIVQDLIDFEVDWTIFPSEILGWT